MLAQFLHKSADSTVDLYKVRLAYYQTPVTGPAEILLGRNIRDLLPCAINHLKPRTIDVQDPLVKRQLGKKLSMTDLSGRGTVQIYRNEPVRHRPADEYISIIRRSNVYTVLVTTIAACRPRAIIRCILTKF